MNKLVLKISSSLPIYVGIFGLILSLVAFLFSYHGLGLQALTYAYLFLLIGVAKYVHEIKTD